MYLFIKTISQSTCGHIKRVLPKKKNHFLTFELCYVSLHKDGEGKHKDLVKANTKRQKSRQCNVQVITWVNPTHHVHDPRGKSMNNPTILSRQKKPFISALSIQHFSRFTPRPTSELSLFLSLSLSLSLGFLSRSFVFNVLH